MLMMCATIIFTEKHYLRLLLLEFPQAEQFNDSHCQRFLLLAELGFGSLDGIRTRDLQCDRLARTPLLHEAIYAVAEFY